jgi:hypothetical protein
MIARRSRLAGHRDPGANQRDRQLVGDAACDLVILRACLDRHQGDGRPIATRQDGCRHRRERAVQDSLPLQGLRRRLAVAVTVLDGKPPAMGEAAVQRDLGHFRVGQALEQLAARALEPHVAQRGARRLVEKDAKLPLQRPARQAGDGGQIRHAPVALQIGAHCLEGAPHAARQHRWDRVYGESVKHDSTAPTIATPSAGACEMCHSSDNGVVNWISVAPGPA